MLVSGYGLELKGGLQFMVRRSTSVRVGVEMKGRVRV